MLEWIACHGVFKHKWHLKEHSKYVHEIADEQEIDEDIKRAFDSINSLEAYTQEIIERDVN